MINEERVRHMTHMAMYEQKNERKYQMVLSFTKKDYVSMTGMIGFFVGTLFFAIVSLLVLGVLFLTVISNVHYSLMIILGLMLAVLYIVYMYHYMRNIKRHARKQYEEGQQCVKKIAADYHKLEEIYDREEHLKAPEGWD